MDCSIIASDAFFADLKDAVVKGNNNSFTGCVNVTVYGINNVSIGGTNVELNNVEASRRVTGKRSLAAATGGSVVLLVL